MSTQDTASEDTASEDTASEDTASEDTASEDTASEDTASQDATARTPRETVEAFLAALEAMDVEGARALMAPDIVYQNVPFPADKGIEATARTLQKFLVLFSGFEVEMLNIAEQGNVVLTERIDTFTNGRFRGGFWVCGTFEVHDGRITLWRDRFDITDAVFQMVRGLVRMPFG